MYDHYANSLFGIVLRIMKNDATAKDVMKDSFMKVWKNHTNYQVDKTKLFTWLLQIFRKTAIEHQKKDKPTLLSDSNSDANKLDKNQRIFPDLLDLRRQLNFIPLKLKHAMISNYLKWPTQLAFGQKIAVRFGKGRLKNSISSLALTSTAMPLFVILIKLI